MPYYMPLSFHDFRYGISVEADANLFVPILCKMSLKAQWAVLWNWILGLGIWLKTDWKDETDFQRFY